MYLQPVIEEIIPTFGHSLKFLDVDATVYRHSLSEGGVPRIKFLRYSATPVIDIDSLTREVLVSTSSSNCLPTSSSRINHPFGYASFATAAAITFALGPSNALPACAILWTSFFFKNNLVDAEEISCTPSMEIVIEAPPYYLGSVAECLTEVEDPDHCPEEFPTFPTCSDHNPSW